MLITNHDVRPRSFRSGSQFAERHLRKQMHTHASRPTSVTNAVTVKYVIPTKAQLLSVPDFLRTVMDTIEPNRENKPNSCSSKDVTAFMTAKAGMPPTQMVAATRCMVSVSALFSANDVVMR
jgi:hypothetical protein